MGILKADKKGSCFDKKMILLSKYGSEEKGSALCKCSILLGFFKTKKLETLRSELLSEVKITNLLGFFKGYSADTCAEKFPLVSMGD